MSYEYSIKLLNPNANSCRVLDELRKSRFFVYGKTNHVALKDVNTGGTWAYDVRVFKENPHELFLEVTSWTHDLYETVKEALPLNGYTLTENEDSELISLEEAFRIR